MKISKTLTLAILLIGTPSFSWASDQPEDAPVQKRAMGFKPTNPELLAELAKRKPGNSTHFSLKATVLPPRVDNTMYCSERMNQGQLGSCTANAMTEQLYMRQVIQLYEQNKGKMSIEDCKKKVTTASRLFLYYEERKREGTINEDAGACIGDGMLVMTEVGVPAEKYWPYSDDSTTFKKKPSDAAYQHAKENRDTDGLDHDYISPKKGKYSMTDIKSALTLKQPLVAGILIYDSFNSANVANKGIIPMPKTNKEQLEGGHAILFAGYDDDMTFDGGKTKGYIIAVNSWGTGWGGKDSSGKRGIFFLPYAFVKDANLTSEIWKIGTVTMPIESIQKSLAGYNQPALTEGGKEEEKKVEVIE